MKVYGQVWQIRANKVKKYLRSFFPPINIKGPYILKDGTSKLFSSSLFFFFFLAVEEIEF